MDTTSKFTSRANDYTIGRPTYSEDFLKSLYAIHGVSKESIIADIGSGTGKFAKQLLEKGSTVICVEPNDDMRNTAIQELQAYENFQAVKGTATETTLKDNSVDFVTVAQAFHWFDAKLFQKECRRILKPDGKIFLIWNMRDMSTELNQHCFEIYQKYCPEFKGFGGGIQKDDERIKQFFGGSYEYAEFDNPLVYDKEKFIKRSLSGSYSLKEGEEGYKGYIEALERVFKEYAVEGVLRMRNKTVVYWGLVAKEIISI